MEEEIKRLRQEIALLKLQFSERVGELEQRLATLLVYANKTAEHSNEKVSGKEKTKDNLSDAPLVSAPHQITNNSSSTDVAEGHRTQTFEISASNSAYQAAPKKIATPSFIEQFVRQLLNIMFDWFSPVTAMYQSYKQRGMLGIFLLTVVGILLTLAGFGYLMELLIEQLGAGTKALLMSVATLSVIGLGIGLKTHSRYGEFGTAIVGLGLLLSYSTVYFSGSVFGLLPGISVILLYLVVALACHGLAMWLDAKVIASLGIIGVAIMPILSSEAYSSAHPLEPIYYLLSLAFVCASGLVLAYKRLMMWLASLSLVFSLFAMEWVMGVEQHLLSSQVSVWLVDLFYLLFFGFMTMSLYRASYQNALFDDENVTKTKDKRIANKQALRFTNHARHVLIYGVTSLGAILMLMFQAGSIITGDMNEAFLLNSVLSAGVSVFFYKIRHPLMHVFITIASVWGILSVVSVLSDAYWGIAWAIEGLLLLSLAKKYQLTSGFKLSGISLSTVNQGQLLIAAALIYSIIGLGLYFPLPALKSLDGWILTMIIIVTIALWQRLISVKHSAFDQFSQQKVKPALMLLEVVCLSVLLIAVSDIWLGEWTGALVIVLQLFVLLRARQCKQVSIEVFAALLISVPLFYTAIGAFSIGTFRFMLLPLYAKLALGSAFIQLWLWSAFYRKFQPDSALAKLAEYARIFFYLLIPVCWLGSVIRRLDENALLVLWLSPMMALFFAQKFKHKLYVWEFKLLVVLMSVLLVAGIGYLSFINGIFSLLGFISLFSLALYLHRKYAEDAVIRQLAQWGCNVGIFTLGFALPVLVLNQSESVLAAATTFSVYWSICFNRVTYSQHFLRNERSITAINLLSMVIGCIGTILVPTFVVVPLLFLVAALANDQRTLVAPWLASKCRGNGDLLLHAIAAFIYCSLLIGLHKYKLELAIAPALAVHGALILFLKDRRITTVKFGFILIMLGIIKLALIDASSALLWQKVMLFMGIGVFILFASFSYQKLIKNTEDKACS